MESLVESDEDADICADSQQSCSAEPSLSYDLTRYGGYLLVYFISLQWLYFVVSRFLAMRYAKVDPLLRRHIVGFMVGYIKGFIQLDVCIVLY